MSIILNTEEIKKLIPHRYPFLFIDRVISMDIGQSIVAIKNVSINEEFFNGHFPGHPVMPGVIGIEACAQAAGVLYNYLMFYEKYNKDGALDLQNCPDKTDSIFYLSSIDNAKFRKTMTPGDQLFIKVNVIQKSRMIWKGECEILINNNEKALEATLSAFIKS